jgi:hypothetical protein
MLLLAIMTLSILPNFGSEKVKTSNPMHFPPHRKYTGAKVCIVTPTFWIFQRQHLTMPLELFAKPSDKWKFKVGADAETTPLSVNHSTTAINQASHMSNDTPARKNRSSQSASVALGAITVFTIVVIISYCQRRYFGVGGSESGIDRD